MTFSLAKENIPKLTFIAQSETQIQEASPKEKEEKGTLMTFPRQKNKEKKHLPSKSKPSKVPSRSPKSELAFLKEKKVSG